VYPTLYDLAGQILMPAEGNEKATKGSLPANELRRHLEQLQRERDSAR